MLRNGADYLKALRDGCRVYLGSELVRDVTTHAAFRNTAHSFVELYDCKRATENRAIRQRALQLCKLSVERSQECRQDRHGRHDGRRQSIGLESGQISLRAVG